MFETKKKGISGMAKKDTYDAGSISVLEGLEAVRKRPGMYIGSVSRKGLNHLIYEIVDNAVDEHLAGYCSRIHVVLEKDGSCTVEDNGRGIPVDMHAKGVSAERLVFTGRSFSSYFLTVIFTITSPLAFLQNPQQNSHLHFISPLLHSHKQLHIPPVTPQYTFISQIPDLSHHGTAVHTQVLSQRSI